MRWEQKLCVVAVIISLFSFMIICFHNAYMGPKWKELEKELNPEWGRTEWKVTVGEPFIWDRPLPPGVIYQAPREHKYIIFKDGEQTELTKEEWEAVD